MNTTSRNNSQHAPMRLVRIGLLSFGLLLPITALSTDGESNLPHVPYVHNHTCEGEKCEYKDVEWTAREDTVARKGYKQVEPTVFLINKGERLLGLDSVVITIQVGIDKIISPCPLTESIKGLPGEVVFSLYYQGEGYFAGLYRGQRIDIDGAFTEYAKCAQEVRPMKTEQWVYVENTRGLRGWVEGRKFYNPSHGGGMAPSSPWLKVKRGEKVLGILFRQDGRLEYSGQQVTPGPVPNDADYVLISPYRGKILGCKNNPTRKCELWLLDVYNGIFNKVRPEDRYESTEGGFVATINNDRGYALVLNTCFDVSNSAYRVDLLTGESDPIRDGRSDGYKICPNLETFKQGATGEYSFKGNLYCPQNVTTECIDKSNFIYDFTIRLDNVPVKSTQGWSNETGHKHAETPQQRAIVAAALNNGKEPPQSAMPDYYPGGKWWTDTWNGDGKRMHDAIQDVHDYWISRGRPALSPQDQSFDLPEMVKEKMWDHLSAGNPDIKYSKDDKDKLIARIASVFNGTVPDNDNKTLQYLGIRAQCKEFADRMVLAGGGRTWSYAEGKQREVKPKDIRDIRPGMYAFKNNMSHTAIIVAVKWDAQGKPTHLRLAEANCGGEVANSKCVNAWSNPFGQIPWSRTVTTIREVPVTDYYVVPTD